MCLQKTLFGIMCTKGWVTVVFPVEGYVLCVERMIRFIQYTSLFCEARPSN